MSNGYTKVEVTISGDALVMHNGQMADPQNKYVRAMQAITKDRARKKTDEGIEALARLEFEAGLYLDEKNRVILPSRVLEAHLCEAARKTKAGKSALAGMFVDTDAVLSYEGGPLTVKQLLDSEQHRLTVGVRVQQARIMRTRPIFKNWSAKFQVSILDELVDAETLRTWIENGGALVGLCDYRPRYGRYELNEFKVMSKPKGLKAAA